MDISLIEETAVDPFTIQAGYYKDGEYYFDVFLASPEDPDTPPKDIKTPSATKYKKFTARLLKFAEINILLTKAQASALGSLYLQNMYRPDPKTEKRVDHSFGDFKEQDIECMLPVMKTSEPSKLFRIQQILHGIQEYQGDPKEERSFDEEIIVGMEFLIQMRFNIFVSGPSWMHMRGAEAEDLEPWDLETEGLGMLEFGGEEITKEIGERQNEDLFEDESESLSLEDCYEWEKVEKNQELEAKIKEIKEWMQGDISIDQLKIFMSALLDLLTNLPHYRRERDIISVLKKF